MNDKILIGLTGHKGAGKSAFAAMLAGRVTVDRIHIATPLKNMLRVLGVTDAQLDGDEKETPCDLLNGATPRHAMQTLGTEWGRDLIDLNLWVDQWARAAEQSAAPVVINESVRFHNELDAIKSRGGLIVRICRPGYHGDNHSSENADLPFDVCVTASTLEELQHAADCFARGWLCSRQSPTVGRDPVKSELVELIDNAVGSGDWETVIGWVTTYHSPELADDIRRDLNDTRDGRTASRCYRRLSPDQWDAWVHARTSGAFGLIALEVALLCGVDLPGTAAA